MFRLVPSVAGRRISADVTDWARARAHCAIRYDENANGAWFQTLLGELRGTRERVHFIRLSPEPDRVERALFDIINSVAADAQHEVAARLHASGDSLDSVLEVLSDLTTNHSFIVDGWSLLQPTDDEFEAAETVAQRYEQFRTWLGHRSWVVADTDLDVPQDFELKTLQVADAAVELDNGRRTPRPDLWQRYAPNMGHFEAALIVLALDERPTAGLTRPGWKLREHVVQRLPDSARDLLFIAGVHGRAISREVLTHLEVPDSAPLLLTQLGMCKSLEHGLQLEPTWSRWCVDALAHRAATFHQRLANAFAAFAAVDDISVDRNATSVLEAHRHYLACGNVEGARRFARYGAPLLVEEAKRQSVQGQYQDAARLYEGILELAERGVCPVGQRLRGYVTHYVHFNRSKGGLETIRETERGYAESLQLWPENALFWSRFVRTQFYRGGTADALASLERARHDVPEHHDKDTVLIARTVRGLISRAVIERDGTYLLNAILVWGEYVPRTSFARGVEEVLVNRLERGWEVEQLSLPGQQGIVFTSPQRIRISRSGDAWTADFVDLFMSVRGNSPVHAASTLIDAARTEVSTLLRAFTHSLDANGRLRKQVLLGAVNLVASRLDAAGAEDVWVVGDIVRDGTGRLWLKPTDRGELYEVPDVVAQTFAVNDIPQIARVACGASGVPIGPVLELRPAYGSAEAVWNAWLVRMGDV